MSRLSPDQDIGDRPVSTELLQEYVDSVRELTHIGVQEYTSVDESEWPTATPRLGRVLKDGSFASISMGEDNVQDDDGSIVPCVHHMVYLEGMESGSLIVDQEHTVTEIVTDRNPENPRLKFMSNDLLYVADEEGAEQLVATASIEPDVPGQGPTARLIAALEIVRAVRAELANPE